jgi:hypothetical protein
VNSCSIDMNVGLRNECIVDTPFFHSGSSVFPFTPLCALPSTRRLGTCARGTAVHNVPFVPRPLSLCLTHLSYHLISWTIYPLSRPLPQLQYPTMPVDHHRCATVTTRSTRHPTQVVMCMVWLEAVRQAKPSWANLLAS